MRKYYTTKEFKIRNIAHAENSLKRRLSSNKRKNAKRKLQIPDRSKNKEKQILKKIKVVKESRFHKPLVFAPTDFRLIKNTEECLLFFRQIRSEEYLNQIGKFKFVTMSLENVTEIDYGTISILTAISDDLKFKNIILRGNFPEKLECKEFIAESGFLNHMYDEKNNKFPKAEKSDMIFFEKGSGLLSNSDNIKISSLVKNVVKHLTGEAKYSLAIKTIILEICG